MCVVNGEWAITGGYFSPGFLFTIRQCPFTTVTYLAKNAFQADNEDSIC